LKGAYQLNQASPISLSPTTWFKKVKLSG